MAVERSSWITAAVIAVVGAVSALGVIQALVVFGGQDWLIPGRTPATIVVRQLDDDKFGFADYVDRTLMLDRAGKLYVDGTQYDDAGLRNYLKKLRDTGGVQVSLLVDSTAPASRREAVEKICAEVTGMNPDVAVAENLAVPVAKKIEVAREIPPEPEVAEVPPVEVAREAGANQQYDLESDLALP